MLSKSDYIYSSIKYFPVLLRLIKNEAIRISD